MALETKQMVEVYDNLTGEHYTRECTNEELAIYEALIADAPVLDTSNDTP